MTGAPALTRPGTEDMYVADESTGRRKSTPGDQSMRRSIQDLVSSIDPNVKIDGEVEDVRHHVLRLENIPTDLSSSYFLRLRTSSLTPSRTLPAGWPSTAVEIPSTLRTCNCTWNATTTSAYPGSHLTRRASSCLRLGSPTRAAERTRRVADRPSKLPFAHTVSPRYSRQNARGNSCNVRSVYVICPLVAS